MTGYEIAVRYAEALTKKFEGTPFAPTYTVDKGRAYHRIVMNDSGRSCHAFVDLSGNLIKSGGWKGPQKDKDGLAIRFRLSTEPEFAATVAVADRYGSYLYQR
jgi:hypothetical protein